MFSNKVFTWLLCNCILNPRKYIYKLNWYSHHICPLSLSWDGLQVNVWKSSTALHNWILPAIDNQFQNPKYSQVVSTTIRYLIYCLSFDNCDSKHFSCKLPLRLLAYAQIVDISIFLQIPYKKKVKNGLKLEMLNDIFLRFTINNWYSENLITIKCTNDAQNAERIGLYTCSSTEGITRLQIWLIVMTHCDSAF